MKGQGLTIWTLKTMLSELRLKQISSAIPEVLGDLEFVARIFSGYRQITVNCGWWAHFEFQIQFELFRLRCVYLTRAVSDAEIFCSHRKLN